MTLFGRYFWTSNYVNEQPKKFPTCHVRNISIYAPTRGATFHIRPSRALSDISIHAPTRGATLATLIIVSQDKFQSTLLQEERRNRLCRLSCKYKISIHAPTRGATGAVGGVAMTESISIHAPTRGATEFERCEKPEGVYFNPRSYKRSDNRRRHLRQFRNPFQSTLLQEERL